MIEDNVMEFCQWLVSDKGIEAGNLSDYINNNEEEVLKLAQEFKKPKFKVGGKVESAAEMLKCGGKTRRVEKKITGGPSKVNKEGSAKGMQYELIHNDDGSITENIYHDHNYAPPGAKIDTRISNVDGTRGYYRNDNGLKYDNSSLDTTAMGKVFDRMKVSAKNIYPAHQKYGITPWEFSYMAAPKYDLPMRDGITVPRFLKKVSGPSGITKEYVVKSDTGERTIRTTDKNGDRYYTFNGVDYHSGSDMYDRYESAFKAYGLQKGGEIKKESIKLGKANYSGFEDLTGKYKRIAYPQDTTWVYRSPDGKMELTAMPTDYGYGGYKIEPGGDSRILTQEEASLLREQIESRIKNIPHKNYLIEKYGEEMFMTENWKKLNK